MPDHDFMLDPDGHPLEWWTEGDFFYMRVDGSNGRFKIPLSELRSRGLTPREFVDMQNRAIYGDQS